MWWIPVKRTRSNGVLLDSRCFNVQRWCFEPFKHVIIFLSVKRYNIAEMNVVKIFVLTNCQHNFRSHDEEIVLTMTESHPNMITVDIHFVGVHRWRFMLHNNALLCDYVDDTWIDIPETPTHRGPYTMIGMKPETRFLRAWAKVPQYGACLYRIDRKIFVSFKERLFYVANVEEWLIREQEDDLEIEKWSPGQEDYMISTTFYKRRFSINAAGGIQLFNLHPDVDMNAPNRSSVLVDKDLNLIEEDVLP